MDYDDDIVMMPVAAAPRQKLMVVMGLIALVFVTIGFGGRSWYSRQLNPPGPPGEKVTVDIPTGARLTDLGSLLAPPRVVANGTLFRFWIRNQDIDLQAGRYVFQRDSSFEEVGRVLQAGPIEVATTSVTIPEGLRLAEVLERINKEVPRFSIEDLTLAANDPANRSPLVPAELALPTGVPVNEGMLFPSTYEVGPTDTASTLIKRMVDEMVNQVTETGADAGLSGDNLPPLDTYRVLVVASLIERETGSRLESPKIARVIYNRMTVGSKHDVTGLGIDATSQYLALTTGQQLDFESSSPYNTRNTLELPPTPIAAPGVSSIEAALRPANDTSGELPLLYYVLVAKGQHLFTGSYQVFLGARDECIQKALGCG